MKNSIVHLAPEELVGFSASPRAKSDAPGTEASATPGGSTTDVEFPTLGLLATTRADRGAEITEVVRHGSADLCGLHVGDVINSVDGKDIRTPMELATEVVHRTPGSRIRVGYTFHTSALGDVQKETVIVVQDRMK